mgnify:CR=1 FL=1
MRKIIAVDIDGYIAERTPEKSYDFASFTPKREVIEKINTLYKQGHVIIYHTARHPSYYEVTYAWLLAQGCWFHALRMGKMAADHYLDDRNANLEDL